MPEGHPANTVDAPAHCASPLPTQSGSRRRRLWDLSDHAHCPVVGVGMPIAVLRRLVERLHGPGVIGDEYALHCLVVSECKRRTPLAETIQKALDARFKQAIRQAGQHKTSEALRQWWRAALQGHQLAESLWVTLTHPKCTPELEHEVLGQVHMLQHQVGMACRLDQGRYEALLKENAVLARHLATAQDRHTRTHQTQCDRLAELDSTLMRTRAELLKKDTEAARIREQLQSMIAVAPDLPGRQQLAQEKQALLQQIQSLRRQLTMARQEAASYRAREDERAAQTASSPAASAAPPSPLPDRTTADVKDKRAVLCVGGRPGIVPIYRQLVEQTGGRFLHHDGGDEHHASQLDATLAAADLVICQTACVSHNAYWRVKDYCKRTGKRCIFLDTPSHSAMKKALESAS